MPAVHRDIRFSPKRKDSKKNGGSSQIAPIVNFIVNAKRTVTVMDIVTGIYISSHSHLKKWTDLVTTTYYTLFVILMVLLNTSSSDEQK